MVENNDNEDYSSELAQALLIAVAILYRSLDENTRTRCITTLRRHLQSHGLHRKLRHQSRRLFRELPGDLSLYDDDILDIVFQLFAVQKKE